MVGVNSPSGFSGGSGSGVGNSSSDSAFSRSGSFGNASAAPTENGVREQRISSKPLHPGPSSQTDPSPGGCEVEKILEKLTLGDSTLKTIMDLMNKEMEKGLYPDTQEQVHQFS